MEIDLAIDLTSGLKYNNIVRYCIVNRFNVPTIHYKYLGVYGFSTYSLFLQGNSDDFVNEAESEDENK